MNNANFLLKDEFPVGSETYDFLQQMVLLNHKLAKIGGTDYILEGCEVNNDGTVNAGFIVIAGEVLPFVASTTVKTYVEIVETRETVNAFGTDYPDAYVTRYAQLSDVDTNIEFVSYQQVNTNIELLAKINEKSGSPVGVVEDWAGVLDKIPSNYILCDGRALYKAQYPDLYAAIGDTYGVIGTTQFKLPDLAGRTTVGYATTTGDYDTIGATGGAENVELTEANLPSHTHGAQTSQENEHSHAMFAEGGSGAQTTALINDYDGAVASAGDRDTGYAYTMVNANGAGAGDINQGQTATSDTHNHDVTVYPTGANQSHENRMPYMVFPKIIKVRY